jgi:hypothetical protein
MNRVSDRIVAALRLRPLTIAELTPMVFSTPFHVRKCLSDLATEGKVRKGPPAPRQGRMGATPHFWEAA